MLTTLAAIVGGLATISTLVIGVFKWITWKTQTTPEQSKENIDAQVAAEQAKGEQTGRPAQ